jgi:formate hydrogenlyase transcriptional activator
MRLVRPDRAAKQTRSPMQHTSATVVSEKPRRRSSLNISALPDGELELLLGESSKAMLRAPAHATDHEIEIWLGNVCQALGVDRAGIFERNHSNSPMEMTHTWVRRPFPPDPPQVIADNSFKSIVRKVISGESFHYSYPSDLPPSMNDLRAWVLKHGPNAGAAVPLRSGSGVFGMVTFGKFRGSRDWSPALLQRLGLVAEIFGNAIERRRTEIQLQAVQAELRVASRRN